MKKIILLFALFATSWSLKAQQLVTVNGTFTNQGQPVVNQEITVIYSTLDSLSPILGYDTTVTDSQGFYSFTKTVSGANFQGYAIVKSTDCFGSVQENYGFFFPGFYNVQINLQCVNICLNSFYASVDSIPGIGLMAKFGASHVTGTASYQWTFGDGTSGVGPYVDHIYASQGTYTVCLTTTDSIGSCTYTYCDSVVVQKFTNQCYAYFSYSQDSADNKTLYFTGQTGNAPGSIITWDFGDGNVFTGSNYTTQTYTSPGIYYVCLGYFDIFQNCFTTYCDVVYVGSGVTPNCSAEYKMFMIPDSVTQGANVIYFSSLYQSPTSTYAWDFGDGSFGSGPYTTHIFTGLGIFDVCLNIYDPFQNCTDTVCKRVEIMEGGMRILGVENSKNISIKYVYPNPAEGVSYVSLTSLLPGFAKVNLMSLDGRWIAQWNKELVQGANTLEIDLTDVEPGMYFIEVISNEDRATSKVMVK
jgi:PKD repeat protein